MSKIEQVLLFPIYLEVIQAKQQYVELQQKKNPYYLNFLI
jgi:hypothetical protein